MHESSIRPVGSQGIITCLAQLGQGPGETLVEGRSSMQEAEGLQLAGQEDTRVLRLLAFPLFIFILVFILVIVDPIKKKAK